MYDKRCIKMNQDLSDDDDFTLTMVNRLYPHIQFKMNEGYLTQMRKSFLSDVTELGYSDSEQAAETVNECVK
jgi:serine protease inhibitor